MRVTKPFLKALVWAIGLLLGTTLLMPVLMKYMMLDPPEGTYLLWLYSVLLWWTIMFLPTVSLYYTIEKREDEQKKEKNASNN
jgi:hypothetical protein